VKHIDYQDINLFVNIRNW